MKTHQHQITGEINTFYESIMRMLSKQMQAEWIELKEQQQPVLKLKDNPHLKIKTTNYLKIK